MTSNNEDNSFSLPEDGLGDIEPIEIQEEMERSFLEYSLSVIISRALPDARDGLKPVHRRILFAMYDQGFRPDRPFVKCARVVGDVMGKYHPHGDSAIYDALARMVQDFSLRHPLIEGHGNFGSPNPDDEPAAMRYTECRLGPLAMELLQGIDEDTVDMVPNYDASEQEPEVLPARFPNLLVNGSQGIAVGMATNIPPHNLGEVIDATIHLINNPDATPDDLMKYIKGPDFPTGALILGNSGVKDAYRTGKGSIKLRAVCEIEQGRTNQFRIVVTEFPYQSSPESIEKRIAELVKNGDLDGISGLQNDSAGRKPRLVIDLKRDANPQVILNKLYKLTPLQTSFGANVVALVDGVPRTLNLVQMLNAYIDHQLLVLTRRSEFRLRKALARLHIVEGLIRALSMLDDVINAIRNSYDRQEARTQLMSEPFNFSEEQANHILDMTLSRLTRLGIEELNNEQKELEKTRDELNEILSNPKKLREVICTELSVIKDKYAEPRKSRLARDEGSLELEDLIQDEEIVLTLTRDGYLKATSASSFKLQNRGGRGIRGTGLKESDIVNKILYTTTLSHILFFTNLGKVYRLRGHEIPVKERNAKGTPIVNLLPLQPGEVIQAMLDTKDFSATPYLLFITKNGIGKKTKFEEYDKSRREGFIAINLKDNDQLVNVVAVNETGEIICISKFGMAIRFSVAEVREVGRDAVGVKIMKLRPGDEVVAGDLIGEDSEIVIITESGFGKRTKVNQFSKQARGGIGLRAIKVTDKKGNVTGAFVIKPEQEILVVSSDGNVIRTRLKDIPSQGRNATGVKVVSLNPNNTVSAVTVVEDSRD